MPEDASQSEQEQTSLADYVKQHALITSPENLDVITSRLAEIFAENKVLAIGEYHGSAQQQAFIRILLPELRRFGLTHLALELHKNDQTVINTFLDTGEVTDGLRQALRGFTPQYLTILQKAKELGVNVIAADPRKENENIPDLQRVRIFEDLLDLNNPSKVLVYYGAAHILGAPDDDPGLGWWLKERTQNRAYLICQSFQPQNTESSDQGDSFVRAIKEAKLQDKAIFLEVQGSPFESEYISRSHPQVDKFKVGNNYDALLYHPQSGSYLKK